MIGLRTAFKKKGDFNKHHLELKESVELERRNWGGSKWKSEMTFIRNECE